jgi:hypothetical protein
MAVRRSLVCIATAFNNFFFTRLTGASERALLLVTVTHQ